MAAPTGVKKRTGRRVGLGLTAYPWRAQSLAHSDSRISGMTRMICAGA